MFLNWLHLRRMELVASSTEHVRDNLLPGLEVIDAVEAGLNNLRINTSLILLIDGLGVSSP